MISPSLPYICVEEEEEEKRRDERMFRG